MKTKLTKEQMINTLIYDTNYYIKDAERCYEKWGEYNINTITADEQAVARVKILKNCGLITKEEYYRLVEKIFHHKFKEIEEFKVDISKVCY